MCFERDIGGLIYVGNSGWEGAKGRKQKRARKLKITQAIGCLASRGKNYACSSEHGLWSPGPPQNVSSLERTLAHSSEPTCCLVFYEMSEDGLEQWKLCSIDS